MTDNSKDPSDIALHRAVQYLATFGRNYITKEEDDSHTNLAWNPDEHRFETRSTTEGRQLLLCLKDFKIKWNGPRTLELGLSGRSHGEVIVWMHHSALQNGLDDFEFNLHYRLESGPIDHDMVYPRLNSDRVKELISLRDNSWIACHKVKEYFNFKTEIRLWPHHFDTAGYEDLEGNGIGFGMAIPDKVADQHYLYVTAYKGKDPVDPNAFPPLSKGEWRSEGFKGAVLSVTGLEEDDYFTFFKESIAILMKDLK